MIMLDASYELDGVLVHYLRHARGRMDARRLKWFLHELWGMEKGLGIMGYEVFWRYGAFLWWSFLYALIQGDMRCSEYESETSRY